MGKIGKAVQIRHVPNAVKGIDRATYPLEGTLGRGQVNMNLSQKTGLESLQQRMESVVLFSIKGNQNGIFYPSKIN